MSFSQDISQFGAAIEQKCQVARRSVTLALLNSVIMDTPVDEGGLRGNWQTTEGNPATGVLSTPNEGPNPANGPSGAAPQNTQRALDEAMNVVAKSDGDSDLYLTNNLPYAHRVEFDGWSHTKAPAGMVRRNEARINGTVINI